MAASAQQIFKDLEKGTWKPFYVIAGEEPFQAGEILAKVKAFFVKDEESGMFNFEAWEGEGLDAQALLSSLETLPGLFSGAGELRLIICQRFDKASPSALEILNPYFANPSETTVFVVTGAKFDKRKSWYKKAEEKGYVVEVAEPYDREWPKWQTYFEKKSGKKIESAAWEVLVEGSGRSLSLLWSEVQKAATYVGERALITEEDAKNLVSGVGVADVFAFADDVVARRNFSAMKRFHSLLQNGENEIKILSILVRQFRMVDQCARLLREGITDNKVLAPKVGTHPFFISKIIQQTKHHTPESLGHTLDMLAECDYRLKTGVGGVFDGFLSGYFLASH